MSIRKNILFSIFLIVCVSQVSAQQKNDNTKIKEIVRKAISENMNAEKIKDSSAVYTFMIDIKVNIINGKQKVKTEINNKEVLSFFEGKAILENIDYSSVIGNKTNSTFFIAGYIIVHDSKYEPEFTNVSKLPEILKYLFADYNSKAENLGNIMIEFDKRIYH